MAYAAVTDVQDRLQRTLSKEERIRCDVLLEDAAVYIDASAPNASEKAKKIVSCRMVIRVLGDGDDSTVAGLPLGTSQGSMSALGYTQSFTIGSGGSTGMLYLDKTDKSLLGRSNQIGSYSPVQELVYEEDDGS